MESEVRQGPKDPKNMAVEEEVPVTGYSNAGSFSFTGLVFWVIKVFVLGIVIFFAIVFGTCMLLG
jgi:hypothetical protein